TANEGESEEGRRLGWHGGQAFRNRKITQAGVHLRRPVSAEVFSAVFGQDAPERVDVGRPEVGGVGGKFLPRIPRRAEQAAAETIADRRKEKLRQPQGTRQRSAVSGVLLF